MSVVERAEMGSLTRFSMVSALALVLDTLVVMTLFNLTGLSLTASAVIGFALIGGAIYFVHEFWTFRTAKVGVSLWRLLGTLAVLILAFATRVIVIAVFESRFSLVGWQAVLVFGFGVAGSFTINFLANRYIVFRHEPPIH